MIRLLAIASFMFFPLTVAFGGGHSNNAEVNKDSSTFMMSRAIWNVHFCSRRNSIPSNRVKVILHDKTVHL